MKFSIVVPMFNRRQVVARALRSTVAWLDNGHTEVIVIDDASTDGSEDFVRQTFADQISRGSMKVVRRLVNGGVTAAKNQGAQAAVGEWIVFLDSDDWLVDGSEAVVRGYCEAVAERSVLVFFRSMRTNGQVIGVAPLTEARVNCQCMLAGWVWGECLPVVRRSAIAEFPYDSDLRGHEAIAYARMTRALGLASVAPHAVRVYDDGGSDRLSTRSGLTARACFIGRGHLRIATEFVRDVPITHSLRSAFKAAAYALGCVLVSTRKLFVRVTT